MDSSSRATLIAGLTAMAESRSHRRSNSHGHIRDPIWSMLWHWCAGCSGRSRQREALSNLDDRLLDDIGVTRQQANIEAAKPFWK
jgi:uncharacterized protein YjiS (DUF1127 family)